MTDEAGTTADGPAVSEAGKQAQARREALYAAIRDVRATLASEDLGSDAWHDAVRAALERTHTTIEEHVRDAESPDGFLAEVIQIKPEFGARVQHMRDDHEQMVEHSVALLEQARGPVEPDELHEDVEELIELLDSHRHRSADLLLDLYDLDLSAGD